MSLATPQEVMGRLEEIESDLATRINALESAAFDWFRAKREKEREWATAFVAAQGTDATRKAAANKAAADIGMEAEAAYEALKAVVRGLETRANIGMALLKAQGRS